MAEWLQKFSSLERFPGRFTVQAPGEGRGVLVFFTCALPMMVGYCILKSIRESLLLATISLEIRSYAHALTASILLQAGAICPGLNGVRSRAELALSRLDD